MHVDNVTVIFLVGLIVAIILHEISHGVVANLLGDDTAKRAGRLTLNPAVTSAPDYLMERHFRRKHGPKAYYGQGHK